MKNHEKPYPLIETTRQRIHLSVRNFLMPRHWGVEIITKDATLVNNPQVSSSLEKKNQRIFEIWRNWSMETLETLDDGRFSMDLFRSKLKCQCNFGGLKLG